MRYWCRGTGVKLQATSKRSSAVWAFAQENDRAFLSVVAIDPFEARRIAVQRMQGRLTAVKPVKIVHPALEPAVLRVLQKVPIQTGIVVPFAPLAEIAAHEEQLLAG